MIQIKNNKKIPWNSIKLQNNRAGYHYACTYPSFNSKLSNSIKNYQLKHSKPECNQHKTQNNPWIKISLIETKEPPPLAPHITKSQITDGNHQKYRNNMVGYHCPCALPLIWPRNVVVDIMGLPLIQLLLKNDIHVPFKWQLWISKTTNFGTSDWLEPWTKVVGN